MMAYRDFMVRFPRSKHVDEAKVRILALKQELEKTDDTQGN
jgi:hypothetical protein